MAGLTLLPHFLSAQSGRTPLLERVISIRLEDETLAAALDKIGRAANCTFSYNSVSVSVERNITQSFQQKTVREVLDALFRGTVQYKERKNYIILTRAPTSVNDNVQKVSGYVVDEATGKRLENVSVYDPVSLSSAITDTYGYFQIEFPKASNEEVRLAIQKLNYTDTVVAVTNRNGLLNIPMKVNTAKIDALADSVGKKLKRFWLSTKRATVQAINMENINDTLRRPFQFSFVPFVGTNHKLSGNVINDYSLNLLGGYSLGVEKLEVGGIFNTIRGDLNGVQVAGFFNGVAGQANGVQVAGIFNANRRYTESVQVAGLVNFSWDSCHTVSMAGLVNFSLKDARGVAMAGLANVTIKYQKGPRIAGLFNFSVDGAEGAQVAGLYNFTAGNLTGAQVGGLANVTAGPAKGGQVSGLFNMATGDVTGAQVSGGINVASKAVEGAQVGAINVASRMKGVQLGVINIADSIKGTPIGVLSIVARGGYHRIEVSADEMFYTNIAYRTGVNRFYNILTVGARPATFNDDKTLWTFGYGIGTSPRVSKRLSLNIDLTANQVVLGGTVEKINLINKLYLGAEYKLARGLGLTAGITLNGYVTDATYDAYPDLFEDYEPHFLRDRTYSNDINLKMWLGGKIGLRFL